STKIPAMRGKSMPSSPWAHWLRSFFRPLAKKARKPRRRLHLEPLESRDAPATYIWTGGASAPNSQKWSAPGNWINSTTGLNQAPTGVGGTEDLDFPSTAAQLSTVNDITVFDPITGKSVPPAFNSIIIEANYTLSGNKI